MKERVRVLVVDDSAFARSTISKTLNSDPQIEVVGVARDGIEALEQVKNLKPSVVTLDVTMPRMDGLAALGRIMAECPTPVVMLSAQTGEQTHATIEALELGAVDFFLKPSVISPAGSSDMASDLLAKVKMAATVSAIRLRPRARSISSMNRFESRNGRTRVKDKVLVIGASTGGPRALSQVIPDIPMDIPAAILIVQHMPAGFTRSLSERLNQASHINVKEAEEGDSLENGTALLAPGGYHMVVDKSGKIVLNQDPLVCGVRPSVDVTMESVVKAYGAATRGVVLTGMGSDGTKGATLIRNAGGEIVVEHESTCAVYGMPRSIVESGNADKIIPLSEVAEEIARMCNS